MFKYLSKLEYPGRGIILGKSDDGKNAVFAYFIMGRSVNSRNRIFDVYGDDIRTKAFDESLLNDPSRSNIHASISFIINYLNLYSHL